MLVLSTLLENRFPISLLFIGLLVSTSSATENRYRDTKRIAAFQASQAHQAAAVDQHHVYAITNRAIGKYNKSDGQQVASWQASKDSPLRHMNSGVVVEDKLYCAHSTWPASPRENSIEIWDTKTLQPSDRHEFPKSDGALTWVDYYQGLWWGVFAYYGESEEVSKTELVQFDGKWQIKKSWSFPKNVLELFLPYSCSGGSWGPDGLLYVTGHDRQEIYLLKTPKDAKQLEYVATAKTSIPGQGIAWDRFEVDRLWGIDRKQKQLLTTKVSFEKIPTQLLRWFRPQNWEHDTSGPIVSLGQTGAFDDTHIFAPCVALENNNYQLWYCGSTGTVANRVFQLGLATSTDGRNFSRVFDEPTYSFGDGKHSVLTPTLLRGSDGQVLRENGKLRMWFSATHFSGATGMHTLHESTSTDGIHWSPPSSAQLEHIYAPTILKDGTRFRMWYTDVSSEPWLFRHAHSSDGQDWQVDDHPVMQVDQPWEQNRLFYPTVVKSDGVYLMWYGSYWSNHRNKTATGFAVSSDGLHWHKHPQNPVHRPDPARSWESHYTTSQSVMQLPDGSWRIWYASRKEPPFVNKYFAINTARWAGLEE